MKTKFTLWFAVIQLVFVWLIIIVVNKAKLTIILDQVSSLHHGIESTTVFILILVDTFCSCAAYYAINEKFNMKTFKRLLKELGACEAARLWAGDMTIEEAVKSCHRGDWLLWLGKKVDIPLQYLTLAKGYCAKTVIHLMRDDRSKNAVKVAVRFGKGKATKDELNAAADAAADAYHAYDAYADAAADAYAAYAANAAYAAAYDAYAAYATYAADAAAYAADADARKKNQLKTANICRKYIGQLIINNVNELLK